MNLFRVRSNRWRDALYEKMAMAVLDVRQPHDAMPVLLIEVEDNQCEAFEEVIDYWGWEVSWSTKHADRKAYCIRRARIEAENG